MKPDKKKYYSKQLLIPAPQEKVFAFMDKISNAGMHMMKSSGMMMGSKLYLEDLTPDKSGPEKTYRWYGKVMGIKLDFTVKVPRWIEGKEKIWETIGQPKMIILHWYKMHLILTPKTNGTLAQLSIEYTLPVTLFFRLISFLLAPIYARWCVGNMLEDTQEYFEKSYSAPAVINN